ncbi:hypothetical protein [Elizabethkingia anophelis]|uniref:hypothetical protein n=1 Tax=Elizabethkingia anophelis TaxID=1117645 RepID=UPI00136FD67E|nr:hypothetical protein [Elizabethkingia anophelis]MYY27282.1 hypothetical protein [Elizabethkingia anophelis]
MQEEELVEKKNYIPPMFEVLKVEMEQGISAGSTKIDPVIEADSNVSSDWANTNDNETISKILN